MGDESVPVAVALSRADTHEVSCHSFIAVQLQKDIQAIEDIKKIYKLFNERL